VSPGGTVLALGSAPAWTGLFTRAFTGERLARRWFGTWALILLPALVIVPTHGLFTTEGRALAAYLGLLPTALAYVLFARGLRRIGAGATAALVLGGLAMLALRSGPRLRVRSRPAEAPA
jgi:drug/metabolite transporter, DME family